jgi:hypothetical protein
MPAFPLLRRDARIATLAAVAFAAILDPSAEARPRPAGGVRVDVGPLMENSGEPTAGWVAQELPGAVAAALASSGQAGTPVSVRIDYVILGPNTGGVGAGSLSPDQMVGEVTSGGVTRPLRATTPYIPSSVDNVMIEQSNHRRVSQLVQAFAYWIGKGYCAPRL